jgi:drug/metabolite transporter (DMT)-like permease
MTAAAFALILVSAVMHAAWNFLLKRGGNKIAFFWAMNVVGGVFVVIPAIIAAAVDGFQLWWLAFGLGTISLHGIYAFSLTKSYETGDLSSVYPISRGMGPAFVPIFAVILLDEHVSVLAACGIALVVVGIYATHIDTRFLRDLSHPVRMLTSPDTRIAFFTGAVIAGYTLWDKNSLNEGVNPITLNGFSMAGNLLSMTPLAFLLVPREVVRGEWRARWRSIVAAGVLAPLGYTLVLIALTTSRVAYIAPAREVGIVLGTAMGVLILGEGYGLTRIWGAALIVAGCIVLGVAP